MSDNLPDGVVRRVAVAIQPFRRFHTVETIARASLEAARYGELVEAVADFRSAVMAPADAETIDKADKRLSALLSTIGEPTDIGGV